MSEEVKGVQKKKAKGEVSLTTNKQNKIKTLSKVMFILAKIAKVFIIIGSISILLFMSVAPVLVKNIKIEDNVISFFGNTLEYKTDGDTNHLMLDNIAIGSLTDDEVIMYDYVISEIKDVNMTKIFISVEISLLFTVAIMVISYFILDNVYKLFTNIHNEPTPFTEDNLVYINKIAYLSLIALIVSFVADLLTNIFFDISMIGVSLSQVLIVLVLYIVAYLFEYACVLQKESKSKMYN